MITYSGTLLSDLARMTERTFQRHTTQKNSHLAASAEVCCPQRRAHSGPEPDQLTECRNSETKHEARRTSTSELGLQREDGATGIPAPVANSRVGCEQ